MAASDGSGRLDGDEGGDGLLVLQDCLSGVLLAGADGLLLLEVEAVGLLRGRRGRLLPAALFRSRMSLAGDSIIAGQEGTATGTFSSSSLLLERLKKVV